MGAKSTEYLTRQEAEDRFVSLNLELLITERLKKILTAHVETMSNEDLEDAVEKLNDIRAGGEGLENYLIRW